MKNIQFQIIDISSDDVQIDQSNQWEKEFIITFYGKTIDQKNVVCNIKGFKPYLYLRIPNNWGNSYLTVFIEQILKIRYSNYNRNELEIKKAKNFYGYNYHFECKKVMEYSFAKISFKTYQNLTNFSKVIKKYYNENIHHVLSGHKKVLDKLKEWFEQDNNCECVANLYESKVHPMLRFLHEKKLESCGWVDVEIPNLKFIKPKEEQMFNVDIELKDLDTKYIKHYENDMIANFITASFDIECDSSHGDFPNPSKDFMKVAIDIHESYFNNSIQLNTSFDFKIKFIKNRLIECFKDGSHYIQNIYTENGTYSQKSFDEIIKKFTEDFINNLDESKLTTKSRDKMIHDLTKLLNGFKNDKNEKIIIKGDPIIQIGVVFHRYGEGIYNRSIAVIGNEYKPTEKICDDINDVDVYECKTEKDLLLKWKDIMLYHNPDIITGYNIFGFDFEYISKRIDYLFPCHESCGRYHDNRCCKNDFYRLGRLMRNNISDNIECFEDLRKDILPRITLSHYNTYWSKKCKMTSKELSSSGLGDNVLKYISMDGRIVFDIQKEIQKGHSLDSYKLDNVSSHFMKGRINTNKYLKTHRGVSITILETNNIGNLKVNDYITFNMITKYGNLKYKDNKKYKITQINHKQKRLSIREKICISSYGTDLISYEWCLAKDDVSPQEIFDFHKNGGSSGRAKIAKYCIMDCELCIHLLLLLDLIPNNIGMANVSTVPLSYIFLRGQGVKINSLVTKVCSEKNTRIPTLKNFDETKEEGGFEGAIVLDPIEGIYLDDPISVLDYASLYPSSIIEKNLSHETYICSQDDFDKDPDKYKWIIYNNDIKNDNVNVISFDDYEYELKGKTKHKIKKDTQTICYFKKEDNEGSRGIIPTILQTLLDQRKKTRSKIKQTNNEDKKKVLDGLQLAYKVTANSVYGQMGAKTSSIFFKKIAACTTSIGRQRIDDADNGVKEWAKETGHYPPEVIYGDTDSVFVKFSRKHKDTGELLEGKDALRYCIDCGVESGEWITKHKLNNPQDLEYEKTFYPFILISKKRYTGDKYELDHLKPKERTSMGIVMKRRDNAAIVKYVFGNVIEIIMHQKSIDLAMKWLEKTLQEIKNGEISDSMFIISKSLRGYYKNPEGIAHKVLADRMAERNPGNKPKPNDRIPYMYRVVDESPIYSRTLKNGTKKYKKRKILQGDRIEHPDYIRDQKLMIDYSFYISNQIMNPVKQVLDLEKDKEETTKFFENYIQE
jgi:DNA polymerase elongation subunit (family B)